MQRISLSIKYKFHLGEFFIRNYYAFVMAFYFLSMPFPILRPGVLASVIMCLIIITNPRLLTFKLDLFNFILFLYLAYNSVSFIFYFQNNLPASIFLREFSNSILPMIFFFVGKKDLDEAKINSFYKIFVISGVFCLIVGIYFLFFPNEMFLQYLERTISAFTYQNYLKDKRLNSFLGSTDIGSLSSMLIVLSLSYIIKYKLNFKLLMLYSLSVLCAGLSMQRSAIVISVLMIFLWHIYGIRKGRINHNFLLTEIIIALLAVIYVIKTNSEIFYHLIDRIGLLGTAISERSDTWINAIKNSPNIVFGNGLGSAGHKAMGYVKFPVHDGSYFKILAETGILGFSLFMMMMFLTYFRYFKTKSHCKVEISIISILLFQAIGSNTLAFQTLLPVFWFSIGRIWSCKL